MFWLNVDRSTGIWKLHKETCRYVTPYETELKGVGGMREKGGWFSFMTVKEEYSFYQKKGRDSIWQPCKICNPQ